MPRRKAIRAQDSLWAAIKVYEYHTSRLAGTVYTGRENHVAPVPELVAK